jgi:pyrroloquinoline quinone (PQQ) biosynthesis protein C
MNSTTHSMDLSVTRSNIFEALDHVLDTEWRRIHEGAFWRHLQQEGMDHHMYLLTMREIYHYTRHNPINQAVAAFSTSPGRTALLRFAYHHAAEEHGHEKMVVRDVKAVDCHFMIEETEPLAPTAALIGYLYYVAMTRGVVARLGYSYWAETAYDHIGEAIVTAKRDLQLSDRDMTFFIAHQSIDTKHAEEVREAIRRNMDSDDEARAIVDVARNSLYMTGAILEAVYETYSEDKRASATRAC